MEHLGIIAIFNSNPDAIDMLTSALSAAGFVVVSALVHELRERDVDLEDFLSTHKPAVIVFDVAPPYGLNWRLLERLRAMPSAQDSRFVVTSVNPQRAEELSRGEYQIHEVVGKPYDLGRITDAVKDAFRARPTRDEGVSGDPTREAITHVIERRKRPR
jgi:CheY-like chemotaxis protein